MPEILFPKAIGNFISLLLNFSSVIISLRNTNRVTTWSCVTTSLIPLSSYPTTNIQGFLSIAALKRKRANTLAHTPVRGRCEKACVQCSESSPYVSAKIAIIARAVGLVFNIKCSAAVPLALKGTSATKNIKNRLTLPACF